MTPVGSFRVRSAFGEDGAVQREAHPFPLRIRRSDPAVSADHPFNLSAGNLAERVPPPEELTTAL
jgi:hypothetical protein